METWILRLPGRAEDLVSLADWLSEDLALPRARLRTVGREAVPGEMGSLADALEVVGQQQEFAVALAGSLAVWIRSRRRHVRLSMQRPDGSTTEVELSGALPDEYLRDLIAQALKDHGRPPAS